MEIRCVRLFSVLLATAFAGEAEAVTASPHPVEERQPDGSVIELRMRGDEYAHWAEDARGFTVIRDRGWFVYARPGAQGMDATDLVVGRDDPSAAGLERSVRPASSTGLGRPTPQSVGNLPDSAQTTGTLRNLVVVLRFANHQARDVPSEGEVDALMNSVGGDPVLAPTGSVRDAYLEYSYGQLDLESTVTYWIDLPNTEQYYAAGSSGLTTRTHEAIRHALELLDSDPGFGFADFDRDGDGNIDAITFLHSGYGAEWGGTDEDGTFYTDRIWSHKWTLFGGGWVGSEGVRVTDYHISPSLWGRNGSQIGRIGVICHELGHFLGLPDLYDTDGSDGEGIGSYGLMANSWGFDGSQHWPPHPSPWSRLQLGWVTHTLIGPGSYSIEEAASAPGVFRIDEGYPTGEYLLVENRQPVGLDGAMPQGGLAIWHIDEFASFNDEGFPGQTGWPQNGRHYRVALLQADGRFDLERGHNRGDAGDVYHADGQSEIGPETIPDTDAYQSGNIIVTDNRIHEISAAGPLMSFVFESASGPGVVDADADGILDGVDNCLAVYNPDQRDEDLDGFGAICDADFDNDMVVGLADLSAVATRFGRRCGEPGFQPDQDLNGDCVVGLADYGGVLEAFGGPPGPSGLACAGAVPCPAP